jgi:tRNA(adenine34) deaminase
MRQSKGSSIDAKERVDDDAVSRLSFTEIWSDMSLDARDEHWMREAIAIATSRGSDPSLSPIGAVIVLGDKAIAIERNQTEERCDATAHAEMMAFRAAGKEIGDMELRGATLYTTLQPCGMCTMASIWSKIGRIVYGAGRDDVHRMYFEDRNYDTINFVTDAYRDDLEVVGGCLRADCAALYFGPDDQVPEEEQGNI